MKTAAAGRAGFVTDAGLERSINEDRVFVDEARGLFMVVDGLGGHAAGETAAETAVTVIDRELRGSATIDEAQIRRAITAANNQILALSAANPAWRGMACVLTLAVASGDEFLIGHVGDSRLYLFWNGKLEKITSDHSPVGEQEDAGVLTEDEAMHHPRRNEVFRDVGSYAHAPDDPQFIEIKRLAFRPDAALLLCSDGLSDLVRSVEMTRVLERYDGDANRIAQLLVEAANSAGGRDNVSAVFIPGPEFLGTESPKLAGGRSRHATTRMRSGKSSMPGFLRAAALLLMGMLIGLAVLRMLDRQNRRSAPVVAAPPPHTRQEIAVDSADPLGIQKALAAALPGDAISVPAGEYLGPLELKERVNIIAQTPQHVVVRADPTAANDAGIAIAARNVKETRLKGLHITGDETHPLRTGLLIANSSIEAEDVEVSNASDAGMRVEGDSHPLIIGSSFRSNAGPGVVIRGLSAPKLVGNRIVENGRLAQSPRAGIEIDNEAQPTLLHNDILQNGVPTVFPLALDQEIRAHNSVDPAATGKTKAPEAKPPKPILKPRPAGHPPTEV